MKVNQNTLQEMLLGDLRGNIGLTPQERTVPFLRSAPGTSKSMICRDMVLNVASNDEDLMATFRAEYGGDMDSLPLIDFRASLFDTPDLIGLPAIIGDTVRWIPPGRWPGEDVPFGVVMADEFPQASPSVMAAFAQAIYDGRLGDYHFPAGWQFWLLGNHTKHRAATNKVPSLVEDRCYDVELDPDLDLWLAWARANGINDDVCDFLELRRKFFVDFDPARSANPNCRSWHKTSLVLAQGMSKAATQAKIEGYIGAAISTEFFAYRAAKDSLPSMSSVVNNPETAKVPEPNDLNALHAVAVAVGCVARDGNSDAVLAYLQRLPAEYRTLGIKQAVRAFDGIKRTAVYQTVAANDAALRV